MNSPELKRVLKLPAIEMNPRGTSEKPYLPVLFREFPEMEVNTPRISLGVFPTPIQRLNRIGYANLWIKRDDMSSHVYGGNKIRKLEIILGKAGRKKTGHIITFGGIGTNHGLATAIFCEKLGIKCTLLLFRQPVTADVKKNLLLFNKFKAVTIYKASPWKTVMSYFLLERIKHPGAYFVYVGGSSPEGTIGYVNAAFELKEQIDRGEMSQPEVIICPLGSGGTLAGLSLGFQLAGLQTSVMGVRVSESHLGPFQACTKDTIERLMKRTYAYLKKRCQRLPDIIIRLPEILHDYFGSGYGAPTRTGSKAYHLMQEKQGIMLDPTYTAKTFAAVLDYCRNHQSGHGPVLYWHTYNSVDLSDQAGAVDYRNLPEPLQRFIKQKSVEL